MVEKVSILCEKDGGLIWFHGNNLLSEEDVLKFIEKVAKEGWKTTRYTSDEYNAIMLEKRKARLPRG